MKKTAFENAWDALPDVLQAHPGVKALYRAATAALPPSAADGEQPKPRDEALATAHEALRRLRAWGGLSGAYSAIVAAGVVDWIDGGMVGPLAELPDFAKSRLPDQPTEAA